ncbi:MAG TPA: LCP family protein [Actinomycetota bacterium]
MTTVLERDPGTRAKRGRVRRLRKRSLTLIVLLAVSAGLGVGVQRLVTSDAPAAPEQVIGDPADGEQFTTLMVTTLLEDPSQQADGLTLFGIDRDGRDPAVMFIPTETITEVPGQGSVEVGKAMSFGRLSLVELAVENLLGIVVDRTVGVDDVSLGSLVDAIGGIDVAVDERLYEDDPEGRRQLVFPLGEQHFDGAAAITYLTYEPAEASDLDRFPRAQKVWEGVFAAVGPDQLARAVEGLGDSVAGLEGAGGLADLLRMFSAASSQQYEVMPPRPVVSGGDEEVFQVDEGALERVIARSFAGSRPAPGAGVGSRVELRNGNGMPEVGERAAAVLIPAGFRIVLSGNAGSFDHRSTRIVVYSDDAQAIAMGERIRALLGVGELEIGTRGQTVADVTVILGADLLEKETTT